MRPRAADLDSVPVGVPQMAGAGEPSRPARKSGNRRQGEYIQRQKGVQEKKCAGNP
jgi:hypothetical protein